MVVECPICSKVLNNEEICSYCGTNINEDIFTDFTSFQKLKNSFSGTFGKGLSKNDKKDLNEFLLNNESKIAGFISKYQSSFENLVLDISAIKKENKPIYEMICKLTDYFEEKKFNLPINQRKSCYTFKRIYDELDDIIPKKNNEYCIDTFNSIKFNLEKLNDFFSVSIPNERISKDKLSYKNQFKDSYDLIKPIKDYALNNSDVFNESQEEVISNFISNFDNFNQNVDDLNNNYDMDQKLNLIIKLSSEISRSNNLDELLKEKENHKELYNLAIEMLEDNESFYYLKNKIELNRNNLNNFKKAYKKLNSKIELVQSENWIKDNFSRLESIKNYETKFPKEFIDNFKFKELCFNFKRLLVNVNCILDNGIDISNQYKNLLNDFIKYYTKFPYIVEESNCYFKINSKTANFNNIEHFKSEILHKFENNLSFKYDCIKNDYELLDNKLDDAIYVDDNWNNLVYFNSLKNSTSIKIDDKKSFEKKYADLNEKVINVREFITDDNKIDLDDFIFNFSHIAEYIDEINFHYKLNSYLIKINKIEQVCELDDFVNQQLKFKKAYIYSKDAIANFSKWLSKKNEEILIDFIDYYDSLDGKIQQLKRKQLKKWLDENKDDFVRFNALRESEITSHLDVDVIRADYRHLYEDCLDLDLDLLDICDLELVDEFRSNYESIDTIVSYLNNRFDIKDFLGSVSGFVLGSSVGVLEKQKEDFKVFFDKCNSFVSRVSDDLLESEKVKINEFKDVYSSIDSKIYKLKVNSWLDSNRNNLIDFNNEISGEISNLVLDDDVEELKRKTEGFYNKIVEFQKYCPFLSQDDVVSSFVYNFENLEDIIADKNCKFKIKQILNEINARNFESNSSEYLEKQKDLFSNYCVISKRIIDSFDDKITDSQKNEFLNFIKEYDNLDNEICNLRIASFFNKHLKEINEFILFTKGTKKHEISDKNRDNCKKEVNYIYDILLKIRDVFNQNPNIKQYRKNLTLEFIEIYENFENIVQRINYQTWFSNNLNDINNFISIKSKTITSYISEEEKDTLKASEDCYNKLNEIVDFHNNVFPSNLDLDIICEFIEDYNNYDNIITKLNVEFFFKDNYEIILWGASLNKVNPFYFIKNEEKEKYKTGIQKIYSNLTKVNQYCVKKHIFSEDKLELMDGAIRNYDNIDDLVIKWNVSYYLNSVVKKFAKIGDYAPDNYFSHNWKQKLLLWHKNAIPKVKKFKEDYAEYISSEDEKFFEKFYNKPETFETDTKQANERYINQELKDNSDLFDDLDGKSLDSQQREAIVVDEDAVKVIAGAGSGKTFTIQGKVKYLTEKRDVDPSEILAISFSNASVDDLKERIAEPIDIKTFHKVGKDILTQYNQYSRPDTSALKRIIKRYLTKKALKNEDISKKLIEFFSFYINVPPSDDDKYEGDLLDWQEGVDFSTLKRRFKNKQRETLNNEIVRSYEELYIANFLFIYGIKYTYEKIYSYPNKNFEREFNKFKEFLFSFNEEIPDELKNDITKDLLNLTDIFEEYEIKDYLPDFYLDDYNIYIEHFGLNRNCENHLIGGKSSEEYVKEMEWKRKVHKKYGTTLIETFSYYQSENRLLTRLAEKLQAQGVEFNEIDYREVYRILLENKTIKEWEDFIVLLKTFIELFKGNNYDETKFKEFYDYVGGLKDSFSKDRTIAFLKIVEEIYNDYEAYLLKIKKIDFNDMINKASDCIVKNGLDLPYKYIIVDEYQDTSFTRYNLLRNICDSIGAKIMVVGDDWQSIYSFSGCDVNIFTKFDNFFDVCETRYIEKTYRNSQQLIDASSNFVMKNPDQTRKELKSSKSLKYPIKLVNFDNDFDEILKFELIIKNIINQSTFKNKKILILGRNNKDIFNLLKNFNVENEYGKRKFEILGDEDKLRRNKFVKIVYRGSPDVNIEYRTVHQSKGLECDNVILINLKNWKAGFPNKMVDDPVLNFVKRNGDSFSYAEERRLFYVALTRTKNNVYLLAPYFKSSVFVQELKTDANVELLNLEHNRLETLKNIEKNGERYVIPTKLKCPVCKTGVVLLESFWNKGKLNRVLKCSHNMAPPFNRCNWEGGYYGSELEDLDDIEYCPSCDGILIKRYRHSDGHPFLGCTNFRKTGCRGKGKKLEYIGKTCPKCGKPLVKRVNGEDNSLFVGCSGFPKCRHTEPFKKEMGS